MWSTTVLVALGMALAGCSGAPLPSVESPRLNRTDLDVLRVCLEEVVLPGMIGVSTARRGGVPLLSRTLPITLWQDLRPVLNLPSLPPIPLLEPRQIPPPAPLALRTDLLTEPERQAWRSRNHLARDIPELGIRVFTVAGGLDVVPRIAVSAPSYPSNDSAILYAEFVCGGACGEGLLVRLSRERGTWIVCQVNRLWIS